MRRLSLATLIFAVSSMFFMGCRQTAGPSAGGSMSSGSMSPAMQSPSFNPFGGTTRVSPPPPNASATQNPYIGGPVIGGPVIGGPPGQTNAVQATTGGFASSAPMSRQAVGSGVQPVGFVGAGGSPTTQAGFANTQSATATPAGGVAPAGYGTTAPANVNQFRAGGMQVNDLTRAPMPPSYQAPMQANQMPLGTASPQVGTAPAQPAFSPMSAPITPANGVPATPVNGMNPVQPTQYQQSSVQPTQYQQSSVQPTQYQQSSVQPTQYQQSPAWQGTNVASVPDAEVASRMVPVTANPSNATVPVTQSAVSPAQNQATSGAGSSDLMWRRPRS